MEFWVCWDVVSKLGKLNLCFIHFLIGNTVTFVEFHLQSWTFAYIRFLDKPYVNEVTLRGQNPPSKCCKYLKLLTYFEKMFRSFTIVNMRSVGQRAAKLQFVKF